MSNEIQLDNWMHAAVGQTSEELHKTLVRVLTIDITKSLQAIIDVNELGVAEASFIYKGGEYVLWVDDPLQPHLLARKNHDQTSGERIKNAADFLFWLRRQSHPMCEPE